MQTSLALFFVGLTVVAAAFPKSWGTGQLEDKGNQEKSTIFDEAFEGGDANIVKRLTDTGLPEGIFKIGDNEYRAITCEGKSSVIYCPGLSKRMYISYANYGRTFGKVCTWNWSNNNCYSFKAGILFTNHCHLKTMCHYTASNNVFGDPCVGVPKYVEVKYTCI